MLRRRREEEIVRKMLHDDSWSVEEGRDEIRGKEETVVDYGSYENISHLRLSKP